MTMIRSMNTLQHNFNIIQKRQETVSANIANINTPKYQSKQIIQSTTDEKQLFNHLGGLGRNQRANLSTISFNNQIEEVYVDTVSNGVRFNESMNTFEENSNVNMAEEMVTLMKISREFEANQKALHTSDETLRKSANEIGKV